MVICTGTAVVTVITGGAAAGPIAAGAGSVAGVSTGTAVGTAASGSIAGAAGSGTLAAMTAITAEFISTAAAIGTGGLGLLAIGTSVNSDSQMTYDCWKPVVHDRSTKPSSGMLLKDMICHPNVAKVTMKTGMFTELPSIVIENIWKETFEIQYFLVHDTGKIVCYANYVDK